MCKLLAMNSVTSNKSAFFLDTFAENENETKADESFTAHMVGSVVK